MFPDIFTLKINKNEFLIEIVLILVFSFLFSIKNFNLGILSIHGGIAALLPNIFFIYLIKIFNQKSSKKKILWSFFFAEIVKIITSIIIIILSINFYENSYLPLIITWFFIKTVQMLIPILIIKINDYGKIKNVYNRKL